jgi:beta-N-acetylhexosaminidase
VIKWLKSVYLDVIRSSLAILLLVSLLAGCSGQSRPKTEYNSNASSASAISGIAEWSNLELAASFFVVGSRLDVISTEVKNFFSEMPVGGVLVDEHTGQTDEKINTLTEMLRETYRDAVRIPPLLAADQEGGLVDRIQTVQPHTGQSEIRDAAHAREIGMERGRGLSKLGLNLVFAPVVDLGQSGDAIYQRSFRGSATEVGDLAVALVQGLVESDVVPCAKHFPGLGGVVEDTHSLMAKLPISMAQWQESSLLPFQAVVQRDIPCLMVGHASTDWWGPDVASQNQETVTYIRDQLQFEGLLVTDDLQMGGAGDGSLSDRAIRALDIGFNALIVTGSLVEVRTVIEDVAKAISVGTLDRKILEETAGKMFATRLTEYTNRGH